MTRKDYELIARRLNDATRFAAAGFDGDSAEVISARVYQNEVTLAAVADALAADNPRFDRGRFLKACGIGQGR